VTLYQEKLEVLRCNKNEIEKWNGLNLSGARLRKRQSWYFVDEKDTAQAVFYTL